MKLEDLTVQHLIEIVRLYEEHCGFKRSFEDAMLQMPSTILEHLRNYGFGNYRIGSKWDFHSKINFGTDSEGNVTVGFNSNFDPRDRQGERYEEAQKSGEDFVKAAKGYLNSHST